MRIIVRLLPLGVRRVLVFEVDVPPADMESVPTHRWDDLGISGIVLVMFAVGGLSAIHPSGDGTFDVDWQDIGFLGGIR